MATLEENINQAIADFDDIESAIEEQGVDVPEGTDTKEYGNLIRNIPRGSTADQQYNPESSNAQSGFAVAEAIANGVAIKYLESPKDNKLYLRDIESGYYVMSGYFVPYPNCKSTVVMDTMYTSVARLNAGSHIMTISPLNFKITCYEILVDDTATDGFTYTRTTMSLLDLHNMANAMVNTVDESSDDEHYPTAKAVYDFAKKVEAQYGNSLIGKASGEVIRVDDVNPIEHKVRAKVSGKNLISFNKPLDINSTYHSWSVNPNHKTVTMSITDKDTSVDITGMYLGLCGNGINGNSGVIWLVERGEIKRTTYTITDYEYVSIYKDESKDGVATALSSRFNIQVEYGDTATEYEPYIDPTTVTVTRCGKNLLPYPYSQTTKEMNGVTFTDNGDGTITVNGTPTENSSITLLGVNHNRILLSKGKTYRWCGGAVAQSADEFYVFIAYDNGTIDTAGEITYIYDYGKTNGKSFTPTEDVYVYSAGIVVKAGNTFNNVKFTPQLEVGENTTDYELYSAATYTPSADGTCEIVSVSPTMTLFTDTEGANIEIEYNQDNNAFADNVKSDLRELDKVTAELTATVGDFEAALDATITLCDTYINGGAE